MQKILKWAFFVLGGLAFVASLVLSIYCAWKLNGLYNAADRYNTKPWYPIRWTIIALVVTLVAGFFLGLAAAWPRPKKTEADRAKEAEKAAAKAAERAEKASVRAEKSEAKVTATAAPPPPDPKPVVEKEAGPIQTGLSVPDAPEPVRAKLDIPET
ncbi:MAG: hypothetical protein LBR33_03145 [Propionibacteriaceae bacterium]|jgi:type VI protein secretion system component VasK|nr:hypothetical protein [Propionibacteriaceae bacterium]